MSANLTETVNVDFYGDVEVTFDYEDGGYFIKKVVVAGSEELVIEDWLAQEVVWALKCAKGRGP